MNWRVAKSLDKLLVQVNATWPNRSKRDDGSIGDTAHSNRSSDHNPWVGDGIVTARDFTHDPANEFDSYAFAEYLRQKRDPRIKYVISNRRIFSSTESPWVWRKYSGANPHDRHVHVSVVAKEQLYDSTASWDIGMVDPQKIEHTESVKLQRPLLVLGVANLSVSYLQRMLGLKDTGTFDEVTEGAVIEFQKAYGLKPDGRVGSYTWAKIEE